MWSPSAPWPGFGWFFIRCGLLLLFPCGRSGLGWAPPVALGPPSRSTAPVPDADGGDAPPCSPREPALLQFGAGNPRSWDPRERWVRQGRGRLPFPKADRIGG